MIQCREVIGISRQGNITDRRHGVHAEVLPGAQGMKQNYVTPGWVRGLRRTAANVTFHVMDPKVISVKTFISQVEVPQLNEFILLECQSTKTNLAGI